jgi:hypothetical protein
MPDFRLFDPVGDAVLGVTGMQGSTGIGAGGVTGIQGLTGIGAGGGGSGFFTDGTGINAAIGKGTVTPIATGANAFAQGDGSLANANHSFASGNKVEVTGSHSAGFGAYQYVAGQYSLSAGYYNYANGNNQLAVGFLNNLYDQYSSAAIGNNNTIQPTGGGQFNFALGGDNTIDGGAGAYETQACLAVGYSHSISYCQGSSVFGINNESAGNSGFGAFDRGNHNAVFGTDNSAFGAQGFIAGGQLSAIDPNKAGGTGTQKAIECFIHGTGVRIGRDYQKTWGSNKADCTNSKIVRYIQTIDATTTTLLTLNIDNGRAYSMRLQGAVREQVIPSTGVNNSAAWDMSGILIYGDSTDPRVVVGGGPTAPTNSAGAASAARISIIPDGVTRNCLVQVTGVAATDYRWCVTLEFTEVTL